MKKAWVNKTWLENYKPTALMDSDNWIEVEIPDPPPSGADLMQAQLDEAVAQVRYFAPHLLREKQPEQDEDCYNCQHRRVLWYDEPCRDCYRLGGPHGDNWEPKQPRNADGDSIADMKAVQERDGIGSVEIWDSEIYEWLTYEHPLGLQASVTDYRIAAKHAKPEHDCHDCDYGGCGNCVDGNNWNATKLEVERLGWKCLRCGEIRHTKTAICGHMEICWSKACGLFEGAK